MTRRHVALALALACLAGVMFLQGCATPGHEWYPAPDAPRMDWYRWEVVERPHMPLLCGPIPAHAEKACVIRLRDGVVKPGDVRLDTGQIATERGTGSVCLILASVSEDEAKRLMDEAWEFTLRDHEVLKHCRDSLNHLPYEVAK